MTSREVMQQALEALEKVTKHFTRTPSTLMDSEARVEAHSAITALRQALEKDADDWYEKTLWGEQQPADEPVAWMFVNEDGECEQIEYGPVFDDPGVTPLYTAPPKREWQGLTDEEIDECERIATFRYQRHKYSVRGQIITPADGLEWHFAGVIEAKLKEKNT